MNNYQLEAGTIDFIVKRTIETSMVETNIGPLAKRLTPSKKEMIFCTKQRSLQILDVEIDLYLPSIKTVSSCEFNELLSSALYLLQQKFIANLRIERQMRQRGIETSCTTKLV